MQNWKKFEANATEYLTNINEIEGVKFENTGGSDSNTPDIKVILKENNIFNIEAKLSPSQSGQFVVHKIKDEFIYSSKNKKENNIFSKEIVSYMNENFDKYTNYGTNQLKLDCPKSLAFDWITNHYEEMNNKFIIVSDKPQDFLKNFIRIIPISQIENYFDVEIVYRIKRSGTRRVPAGDFAEVEELLEKEFPNNLKSLNKHSYEVTFQENAIHESQSLSEKYHLSKSENKYVVRKRSQTFNANIIFSLTYKGEKTISGFDNLFEEMERFEKLIRK